MEDMIPAGWQIALIIQDCMNNWVVSLRQCSGWQHVVTERGDSLIEAITAAVEAATRLA